MSGSAGTAAAATRGGLVGSATSGTRQRGRGASRTVAPVLLDPPETPRRWHRIASPVGPLVLTASERSLTGLHFDDPADPQRWTDGLDEDPTWFDPVATQLDEYFAGERTTFDLRLAPTGTPFQLEVWGALCRIGYGETWSYVQLARAVGRPTGSRAVGTANGRNPISIIVPCHRVIGADGSLTGYGGGLDRKRTLLELEQPRLPLG
jgi:methylated-DNA-[protein]-cysteine S-methyltransferase